tara:strand:+ start:336 stop:782 length:447 start_codon:yes stop_codon:yes gene_type:complete
MSSNYLNRYGVGLHNVGSYQVAGWPWITGSAIGTGQEHHIKFPMVTKELTIIMSGTLADKPGVGEDLKIHFTSTGSDGPSVSEHHFITLANDQDSITLNVKCKEVFVSAYGSNIGYECIALLTNVPTGSMFILTGSGVNERGDSGYMP